MPRGGEPCTGTRLWEGGTVRWPAAALCLPLALPPPMPELPEAETLVRGLRPLVVGRTVRRVDIRHADVLRTSARRFRQGVAGRRFAAVGRRGKNVLLHLDDGSVVAVNLGMTGTLLPFATPPRGSRRPSHPAVVFRLRDGGVLFYQDIRRFGTVEHLDAETWAERSARMGPEPLAKGYTAERLHEGLSVSRSPVRSWLLDQRRIAGVGNIYANEALYLSGIDPRRPANSVTAQEARALHGAIRGVLTRAIDAGGTTIRDYRNAEGKAGAFATRLEVYGREGEPCRRCGHDVQRTVLSNRSAFFCPRCQPWDAEA